MYVLECSELQDAMSRAFSGLCRKNCLCASGCTSQDALQQCTAHLKVVDALKTYFEFGCFRPGQLEAVLPALHGRDVFVRIPTGGGKSLCMFLVALSYDSDTLGVIISPLIGLMDEQVYTLLTYVHNVHIPESTLHSD